LKKPEDLAADDFRSKFPRFQGQAFYDNLKLVVEIEKMAERKGVTPAQIAINWLVALSGRNGNPVIVPIPGSSTEARVVQNSKLVTLTEDDLSEIQDILKKFEPVGGRYNDHGSRHLNG
jgi:pyridoxine 4-dehydrogenase